MTYNLKWNDFRWFPHGSAFKEAPVTHNFTRTDNQRLGAESTVPASQLTRSGDICSVWSLGQVGPLTCHLLWLRGTHPRFQRNFTGAVKHGMESTWTVNLIGLNPSLTISNDFWTDNSSYNMNVFLPSVGFQTSFERLHQRWTWHGSHYSSYLRWSFADWRIWNITFIHHVSSQSSPPSP